MRVSVARLALLNDRVPELLFSRFTQLLLDSGAAGLALFFAFQLRFDGAVPLRYRSIMLTWLAGIIVLRPVCIWLLGAYASIWRYFNLRDMFSLSLGAALPSTAVVARTPCLGENISGHGYPDQRGADRSRAVSAAGGNIASLASGGFRTFEDHDRASATVLCCWARATHWPQECARSACRGTSNSWACSRRTRICTGELSPGFP